MARQPSYRPLQPSDFFADGRSARPLEPGTVPRGFHRADPHLDEGKQPADVFSVSAIFSAAQPLAGAALLSATGDWPAETFPFSVTEAVLRRGRERFNIYCSVCHDRVGTGNGRIVQRGYIKPPSYHTERLRQAPVGHFFQVITNGHGAMPDYAANIEPSDRWAIIAYIRALQESQNARLDDVPAAERLELNGQK